MINPSPTCCGCRYAEWRKTTAGRLHPSGDGRCGYVVTIPPIPISMWWGGGDLPRPRGGEISRREALRNPCPVREEIEA